MKVRTMSGIRSWKPWTAVAVAPLLAVIVGACGGSGGSNNAVGKRANSNSTAGPPPGVVTIATSTEAGRTHLVSGSGRTIYLWVADKSDTSQCTGACAKAWPPVVSTAAPIAASGANSADLGTTTRSDGSKQVTYNGHPLYFFLGDQTPGATYGQGNNNFGAKWWLVAPSGNAITAVTGGGSSPAGSSSSGG
jgi:predicted lipoprotein with Yx(FWY)xxD motif